MGAAFVSTVATASSVTCSGAAWAACAGTLTAFVDAAGISVARAVAAQPANPDTKITAIAAIALRDMVVLRTFRLSGFQALCQA
ncbi:MAG: hypothetical protein SGJ23_12795 [Alphaproteobacteria bacterium]|nr:hypothetical protein [Alphaproteobacteria bacterium]